LRSPKNPSPRIKRWAIRATLLLALALVSSVTAFKRFEPRQPLFDASDAHTYSTVVGAFRRIPLDDGSTIELNTNTSVRVELTKQQREITLFRGEAHFDVESAATRPFVVHAGHTVVRALGTAFVVRVFDDFRAAVLVTQGRVGVSTAAPPEGLIGVRRASDTHESLVSAGENAIDNAGHMTIYTLEYDEMATRQAWRHGSIIFMDRPLREVVSELNRYNEKQIRIIDASIANVRFSGQLALRGTDRFLVVLAKSHGILAREVAGREDVIELRRGDDAP
jgi:transmembrane sensor